MVNLLALGPIELWKEGRQHSLGSVKERCVLAVLLHARGEPVPLATIAARVWDGEDPPLDTAGNVRTYVSRLKRRLRIVEDAVRLERCAPGRYRLSAAPEAVDLTCFQNLRVRARAAVGRHATAEAIGLLREAEALWRGEPLLEFGGEWAKPLGHRLHEDLIRVTEERISLELAQGGHADLVGELYELVARNPFAQRAVGYLMKALYRSGRHAESLDVYRTTYRLLRERLGIRPDAELQRLNRQIIDQDPELDRDPAPPAGSAARPSAAAGTPDAGPGRRAAGTLPRDTAEFTGRAGQLAILLADPAGQGSGEATDGATSLPLTVVYGMAGIGKTATAVRAAYRLRERYPDGQFYVDLRGYSDQSRCEPREALASLLRSSGAATELPESLDERAARWREWTARHRALVVLDNARATYQVNPLLPGAPTCRAIVTSRNRLSGLDGATLVFLDVLSLNEGMELFTRVAGTARTNDRVTLSRVVDACGRHPLAIQLLAGHYRHRDSWDLEHLLERLTDARDPLAEFDEALTATLQLSYAELAGPSQHLLRLLALHPGPDITLGGTAALLGTDRATARQSVEGLLDAHLLNDAARDRFALHDLVRAFAVRVCRREEPDHSRNSATHRLLTYYLHSADRADRLVHPRRRRLPVADGDCADEQTQPALGAEEFGDADEASVWLEVEGTNLLAAARTAKDSAPSRTPDFSHVLAPALTSWGMWRFAAELHAAAVSVLRSGTDRRALAQALTDRAGIRAQECPSDAVHDASEALALFEELGDVEGSAAALLQLGRGRLAAGRGDSALRTLDRALRLHRERGDRYSQAEVLNVQGVALHYGGDHRSAAERFRAMLRLAEELGDIQLESKALNNMGDLSLLRERYEEAREHFERSLDLARRFGGRRDRVILDTNLAVVYNAMGEPERALTALKRALASYTAGGDTSGEADTLIALGNTYADMGRRREALLHFTRAEEVARRIDNGYELARALVGKADLQRASGRVSAARDTCEQALRISREINYPLGAARALDGLARAAALTASASTAHAYAEDAIALYEKLGAKADAASLRRFLGSRRATGS